jgi:hypothetical protein
MISPRRKQSKYKYFKLFKKLKMTQADMLTLKIENTIEKEEYLQRQNDVKSKTEAYKELYKKVFEQGFSCWMCLQRNIRHSDGGRLWPHILSLLHHRKKPKCPICRKYICIDHTKHVESWGWTFTLLASCTHSCQSCRRKSE